MPFASRFVVPALASMLVLPAIESAHAQLRVVSYNTLERPTSTTDADVRTVMSAIAADSVNGIAKRPDLLIVQEQDNNTPTRLAGLLNNLFGVTTYSVSVPGGQPNTDRQAFVYDSSTLALVNSGSIATNTARPVLRAEFRPTAYADARLHAYGMHLMATDATGRALQTSAARADSNSRGSANLIYAGDFNIDSSSETSYTNLTGSGNGQAFDPINRPGTWTNNSNFADIHTQSTRLTQFGGGASGGMDDRFDFQVVSGELMDGEGLSYIGPTAPGTGSVHSYRTFGNGGNTFNNSVNAAANTSKPRAVLDALYNTSDHLPIVADYQLPALLAGSASGPALPSQVIVGASLFRTVTISNVAPAGNDELDYALSVSGASPSIVSGTVNAGASTQVQLTLDTTTPGTKSYTASATATSQEAEGTFADSAGYSVLDHAKPSFTAGGIATRDSIDLGIVALGAPPIAKAFDVFNAQSASPTAALDIDSVTSSDARLTSNLAPLTQVAPGSSVAALASFTPDAIGAIDAELVLSTSDQDLPGATALADLVLDVTGLVTYAGDTDTDFDVDFADLVTLAQNYGTTTGGTWALGDFDRTGTIEFADLVGLAQNYGLGLTGLVDSSLAADFTADWQRALAMVPEPTMLSLLTATTVLLRRRRRDVNA